VIEAADLAVTKTANPRAQVGQGLTYTVTVTNNGPSTATGVVLARVFSDVLDPNPANNTASLTTAVFQCCTGFPC
jgi:uncharacterized repeat protein (TIGR01451 family)